MNKKDDKMFDEYRKLRFHCRHCGSSVTIYGWMDKRICRFCGYWVFQTPKDEFMFRVGNFFKNGG